MSKLKERERKIVIGIGLVTIKLLDILDDLGVDYTCLLCRYKDIDGSEEKYNSIVIRCTLPIYRWILVELKRLHKEFPEESIWFVKEGA